MSDIQANCPHCGTSFSVASEQLKVANGHVRCGVCMKVFKAGEGVEEEPKPQDIMTASSKESSLDNDANIEEWIKKNQKSHVSKPHGPVEAPENDSSIESLSFDDEISDAFEDLKPAPKPGSNDFEIEEDQESIPAFAATLEDDNSLDSVSDPAKRGKATKADDSFDDLDMSDDPFDGDGFADDYDNDIFSNDDDDEPVVHVSLGSTDIEDEPTLEARLQPKKLWPSLTIVFSLLLITQLLVKNFNDLAIDPSYRGFYSVFCSMGICDLPPLENVDSIRASNLIVRPHPKQKGALIVDAIMNNRAPFDQAFPKLLLSFSNIQGKTIASRLFTPEEYLQGELTKLKTLPSQSPLHLSIEIVDPGKKAISYHLDFLPNS
jgi:predicted Zn finger-like uncharacterized protein